MDVLGRHWQLFSLRKPAALSEAYNIHPRDEYLLDLAYIEHVNRPVQLLTSRHDLWRGFLRTCVMSIKSLSEARRTACISDSADSLHKLYMLKMEYLRANHQALLLIHHITSGRASHLLSLVEACQKDRRTSSEMLRIVDHPHTDCSDADGGWAMWTNMLVIWDEIVLHENVTSLIG